MFMLTLKRRLLKQLRNNSVNNISLKLRVIFSVCG
jgi:hypothetical protein